MNPQRFDDRETPTLPLEVGDEVYFQGPSGPVSGKVASVGKHGAHVSVGGTLHRVRWRSMLGHKTRMVQRHRVVEEGADGMILERGDGRRIYVAGSVQEPVPDAQPQAEKIAEMLHKAYLASGPDVRVLEARLSAVEHQINNIMHETKRL